MPVLATPAPMLVPSATKVQLQTNYVSYYDWTSVYKPDAHQSLAMQYGNQRISGMLAMFTGGEQASDADQFIWAEEGRLRPIETGVTRVGSTFTAADHRLRLKDVVSVSDATTGLIAIVTDVPDNDTFVLAPYGLAGFGALGAADITVWIIGSEHEKGSRSVDGSLQSDPVIRRNKPVILRRKYQVSASDATNIGWIQTSQGWLWFLKSEYDTRVRFEDELETMMLLAVPAEAGSDAATAGNLGTEGLFYSVRTRGNVFQGVATTLADWDSIVDRFDQQGNIADYMFYCDRAASRAIDNLLGTLNAGYADGISYGIFNNSKDMAVNLGFKGFTRNSYNFFKTDWKLLNDPTSGGAIAAAAGKTRGMLIPVGTTSVYKDGVVGGEKITVPFLHLKYKAAGAENRKMKIWPTGAFGAVKTNDEDGLSMHYLSERGLCATGINNFMIFEGE